MTTWIGRDFKWLLEVYKKKSRTWRVEILKWVESSNAVDRYWIREYRLFKAGFYLNTMVTPKDGSKLFISAYSDSDDRKYSYHWQDKEEN